MERNLTFGEKACGVSFNPSGRKDVDTIKQAYAALVDVLHAHRMDATNPDAQRIFSIAITETQTAQMWAVKAVTWQY